MQRARVVSERQATMIVMHAWLKASEREKAAREAKMRDATEAFAFKESEVEAAATMQALEGAKHSTLSVFCFLL